MPKKCHLTKLSSPGLTITRHALGSLKLVYVAQANKTISYPWGKSRIAYIGTTEKGIQRISGSAAKTAEDLLWNHGLHKLDYFIVTCTPRKKVRTWRQLESALLITFRQTYGAIPIGNQPGGKGAYSTWGKQLNYFTMQSLNGVITTYS